MLTGVALGGALRITGPVPYAWVFLVVFLALIGLIFFLVYGRGNQPGRQAGHHSRRRNAHKPGHATAHASGHGPAHASEHGPAHTSEHGPAHKPGHETAPSAGHAPERRQNDRKATDTGRPPGDDSTGRSSAVSAVGIASAGLAFLTPVDASVSPGLKLLPSWNTVRLEPCCAFRREATCAPATARPREHMLPGALSCPGAAARGPLAVSRQLHRDGGDLRGR